MKPTPEFREIDQKSWKRVETFYYFSQIAPTGYSLTVNVDVTHFRQELKNHGKKFFPAYLWIVTKTLMEQEEFKIAEVNGKLGVFNSLTPLYAVFHQDDKTFSFMWTEYDDDFNCFYNAYIQNDQTHGNNHGVLAQKGVMPPQNAYTISCIPWVQFEHFAVHSFGNKPYYFPSVEAGKFFEKDGKILLPLSLTCHHATTDGYHVNAFIESLQKHLNEFAL